MDFPATPLEVWPETPVVMLSAAKHLFFHYDLRPFAALGVTEKDFPATLLGHCEERSNEAIPYFSMEEIASLRSQ